MARRQAKQRAARRSGAPAKTPAGRTPTPAAEVAARPAIRLGQRLTPTETVAVIAIAVTGLSAFAGFVDGFDWYDANPLVALALTFLLLGAIFAIERRALTATSRASLRFAGAGLVVPLLWWAVPFAAMTPIAAMSGYTSYRLGVGSVFPPAFVGAILTGSFFGATAGMLAATASVFGGTAALLFTRPAA